MNKTVLTLLGTVRESYDYVLIDLPPLGSVIDAAVVAAKCDGAILVISDHQAFAQAKDTPNNALAPKLLLVGVPSNSNKTRSIPT